MVATQQPKSTYPCKIKNMQISGNETIRTQLQPSNATREITKITNSQNKKRTYGQPSEQYFPKGGHSATQTELKTQVYYLKVGCKGVKITWLCCHHTRGVWKVRSMTVFLSNQQPNLFMFGIVVNSYLSSMS